MAENIEFSEHTIDLVAFRKALIIWGQKHFRPFPWRQTENPYHLLIAEIMLHRTQAVQVVPVYEQFVIQYPNLPALAKASRTELHEILYSLGLRWRVELIYDMAVNLINNFGGYIPDTKKELLSLPGISDYIASAVCCFAWNQPEPLIDTNTVRVTGRLFGLEVKDSSRRNPQFKQLITTLVDRNKPREYNYSLLDLADKICYKRKPPDCMHCPVRQWCIYGHRNSLPSAKCL